MAWKIEPEWKKSITQVETWTNKEGQRIVYSLGWRWGTYTVEAPEDTTIEQFLEEYDEDEGVNITEDFELIDAEESDGVWDDYDFYNMTEEEEEGIREFLEEGNSIFELEEHGWTLIDSYTTITGPLSIEEVN